MDACSIKVLLVGSDEDTYRHTQELLTASTGSCLALERAFTYAAALELIQRQQYDVYLLDYILDTRTGLELLQVALHGGCVAPIILLSQQYESALDRMAMQAGAADYLAQDQLTAALLERSISHAIERKKIECALQHAVRTNGQMAAAINNLATGVVITDPSLPDNPIIFANPGFTVITGYLAEEVLGRNCRFLQGPGTEQKIIARIREAVADKRSVRAEFLNYTKSGQPFWNSLSVNPIFNEAGEVVNFVGLVADVTQRKRNEEALRGSEARLRLMAETSSGALYERKYGADTFDYISPVIQRLTGYTPQEINEVGWRSLIQQIEGDVNSIEVAPDVKQRLRDKGDLLVDYQIRTKHGELRWLSDHSVAWQEGDDSPIGWVGILSDVTARKAAEARHRDMAEGMQAVLEAADELLNCPDLDALLRHAVELGRDKLGLERCGISLLSEDGATRQGAYGTNMQGETTDERAHQFKNEWSADNLQAMWKGVPRPAAQPLELPSPIAPVWSASGAAAEPISHARWFMWQDRDLQDWVGRSMEPLQRKGWVAETPIQSTQGPVGIFSNDNALTGALVNEDKQEIVVLFCSLLGNIIERKRAEQKLAHNAFYDGLTQLPNRALFLERLERAVKRRKRHPDYVFAVLFLDLDRFKNVNDSLGHSIGDALLVAATRRLEQCLREEDTVARLGGDEFTILIDDVVDVSDATIIAERIQQSLSAPFQLDSPTGVSIEWFTSASIGIAMSATGYETAEEVLRDADIAMYRAKAEGKARYAIFDIQMHEKAQALLRLETDLWHAVERAEFCLHYQPIVELVTGDLIGFEALVRWQHPQRGLVSPLEFIPIMEDNGLILPLGQWVLREACRQMGEWQAALPAAQSLVMCVNVSSKQFSQPDLVEQVRQALSDAGLETRHLKLEITESVIMENANLATAMLNQFKDLGVRVAIDDFGTGYSSLSSLHLFPLAALKVDRSFTQRLGPEGENKEIIQTIVTLAHNLGMVVIAEGIETLAQIEQLKALECAYGQGYHFSKPLPAGAATAFIERSLALA